MSRISFSHTFYNSSNPYTLAAENHFETIKWLKEKIHSKNFIAFSLVATLHLSAIFTLFYSFSNHSAQPIISFTVTMMDSASTTSSNSISTAASKFSTKTAAKNEEKQLANIATANQSLTDSKATQSHNSDAQSAVIAPTTAASFDAAYLNNPSPTYPSISRRLQEQGTVTLNVFVDDRGQAQNVAIKTSSGFSRLDVAALETVKKWRFSPAKQGEKFVASWVQVPVSFVLEK